MLMMRPVMVMRFGARVREHCSTNQHHQRCIRGSKREVELQEYLCSSSRRSCVSDRCTIVALLAPSTELLHNSCPAHPTALPKFLMSVYTLPSLLYAIVLKSYMYRHRRDCPMITKVSVLSVTSKDITCPLPLPTAITFASSQSVTVFS